VLIAFLSIEAFTPSKNSALVAESSIKIEFPSKQMFRACSANFSLACCLICLLPSKLNWFCCWGG
jgi:hypothetical protein